MPAMAAAARFRVRPPGRPTGAPCPALLWTVVARSATYDPEQVADTALERLAAGPEDRILELGCGSGRLLFRLAARARRGRVVGLDPSALMVRHARHRNRRWIEAGRAEVVQGWSHDLSRFPDAGFDRVLGVHVACFWEEPGRDLAEVRRVLRPGGRLLLGFRPAADGEPGDSDRARLPADRVEGWLRGAGFFAANTVVCVDPARPLAWVDAGR
jgi:SAM-dependent methyltransferase